MRICVIHSSYEGTDHLLEAIDEEPPDPSSVVTEHTFENRFVTKSNGKAQIDALAAEKFDFYINFMWGLYEDSVAGIDESAYFESLSLPSVGIKSWERKRSKKDFFVDAKRRGEPPVPGNGTDKYPVFVKPANGCSSLFIDERSVCHDEQELESCIQVLNRKMRPMRMQRAKALSLEDPASYADSCESAGRNSDDLVVQEYIDGIDYSVDVISMGDIPVPLTPRRVHHPPLKGVEQFLTFDAKNDERTRYELLREEDNPALYRSLQKAAVEASVTNAMHLNGMGCDVDIRATREGQVFVIEINPMPVAFYPTTSNFTDVDIHDIPGRYEAAVNIFITNYYLKNPQERTARYGKIAEAFDAIAPVYSTYTIDGPSPVYRPTFQGFTFEGDVLDLGCGTGLVGQRIAQSKKSENNGDNHMTTKPNRLIGVDISKEMIDMCRRSGTMYTEMHVARMEQFLSIYNDPIDHIVCVSALQYLSVEELYFVLARCFQLATKSVTISVDEIPEMYNVGLRKQGNGHMVCSNHAERVKSIIREPEGWRLVCLRYHWSWKSPKTGDEVYTNFFRWERKKVQVLRN